MDVVGGTHPGDSVRIMSSEEPKRLPCALTATIGRTDEHRYVGGWDVYCVRTVGKQCPLVHNHRMAVRHTRWDACEVLDHLIQ